MLPLVADENFNNNIMRGLLRQKAYLDLVRIQDMGLAHADDPTILAWAAQPGRVLLTHDVSTITKYAYERIEAGQAMPNEGQEPPHIHIKADRDQAKFWLEPIALASNYGFKAHELNEIERIIRERHSELLEAWHEHLG